VVVEVVEMLMAVVAEQEDTAQGQVYLSPLALLTQLQ
jgi:hypothetical protein